MRLKKIKLAGFKSFVDPTQVEFPHQLTGIVGPNGCGKSNVIDAVRWVMGESSAKMLRGQSMEDVIFSGSQSRKPVGKAFVELIFDNTVGQKAPGNYAKYSEIAIRREVTRDGRSDYFLNRTKCRKKDIVDVFLGTGLGPRAYSIIEQGMVTRIIESKPDELRVFVEEAAGISRYKERRRETENRIRHTRENLSRVEDIRSELESQLARLKRQASAARRYKEYKSEERRLQSEVLALRWQGLTDRISREETELENRQTSLEAQLAMQRETEADIEKTRQQQHDANETFNQAQGQYYQTGAEVSRVEQSIQHARDSHQEKMREKEQLDAALSAARAGYEADSGKEAGLITQLNEGTAELEVLAARNEQLAGSLAKAEADMHDWQQRWDDFSSVAAHPAREREVQSARIKQINDHLQRLQTRRQRLAGEDESLHTRISESSTDGLREDLEKRLAVARDLNEQIERLDGEIQQLRRDIEQTGTELNSARVQRQSVTARLETLRELQDAALGRNDQQMHEWLGQLGMQDLAGLADSIQVEKGWETAVDRVLGSELTGVCLAGRALPVEQLDALQGRGASFFEAGKGGGETTENMLASRIRTTDVNLNARLVSVYIAEDIAAAIAARDALPLHAVSVTRDGDLVGQDWISLSGGRDEEPGVMSRQTEIDNLSAQLETAKEQIDAQAARHSVMQEKLTECDRQRSEIRERHRRETTQANEDNARLHRLEAELDQMRNRKAQIERELTEIDDQVVLDQAELTSSDDRLAAASKQAEDIEAQRNSLLEQRNKVQQALDESRSAARESDTALHHLQLQRQEWEVTIRSLQDSMQRTRQQLDMLRSREKDLEQSLQSSHTPEQDMQAELDRLLARRLEEEGLLKQRREQVVELESRQRELERKRHSEESDCQALRESMEQEKMKRQEQFVRRQTLEEQLAELEMNVQEVLASMSEEADEAAWTEQLETITRRITRLGAVNLMAIEEYEEQSERKGYLDKQHADLSEALATLEGVMGKIDRETRTRFKETFDQINDGFQRFFPKLFGGGHAYLELTGEDLLDAGVAVMARPPGKRNSTINLLSGGEKALTAVAMLFAIFELNPAPFCLLDEVDAPLDEANVSRYCETLKSMADHTQLIYITHNKVTMESAHTLLGVTMAEPGVSRLVSVNLKEAEKMAS